ncbi:MAG: transcription-repair coupling factor, partial [Burkholderiaceae bacterium]|nr:transcription-repair coupling factor [Burkholderiaceae bacterium]
RLSLYKRLAGSETLDELRTLQEEMIDRFGKLPDQAQALMETHRLRIVAKAAGIIKIDAHTEALSLQFIPNPPIDAAHVIELLQKNRNFRLTGPEKLRVTAKMPDIHSRATQIRATIHLLTKGQPS